MKVQQFSRRYPAANRKPNDLSVIEISIEGSSGVSKMTLNDSVYIACTRKLPDVGRPTTPSVISGKPGFVYRAADDVEIALTEDELIRLLRRELRPDEFFALARHSGVFYELHDDFYDEDSGEALQPMEDR